MNRHVRQAYFVIFDVVSQQKNALECVIALIHIERDVCIYKYMYINAFFVIVSALSVEALFNTSLGIRPDCFHVLATVPYNATVLQCVSNIYKERVCHMLVVVEYKYQTFRARSHVPPTPGKCIKDVAKVQVRLAYGGPFHHHRQHHHRHQQKQCC